MTPGIPNIHPTGALSGREILTVLDRKQEDDPLVVMPPFYDEKSLLSANCLDLRLGHEFILMRRAELPTLAFGKGDDFGKEDINITLHRFYETTYVGFNDDFVLHPGELVLGSTLEYVVLPKDVMGYIIGRSSWGRLGLIIATAIIIHPGFKGCPTLEIVNIGNIPIHLFPGSPIPIAQVAFHWVGPGQKSYAGRYSTQWVGPTGPGYSRIHIGDVFEKWIAFRKEKNR
ncbi:MAG: dCTP deaminase [Deltaproteobacteria bacterium]|nr:dCTP deaminase [Deltaproteobacteria bacterium]